VLGGTSSGNLRKRKAVNGGEGMDSPEFMGFGIMLKCSVCDGMYLMQVSYTDIIHMREVDCECTECNAKGIFQISSNVVVDRGLLK
jgi:hypothetical protein